MRTRSEWFLGARGSSLELSARQFSLSTSSPPMSSTPVPGSLSANIGSYNFYTDEIDVVSNHNSNHIDNVIVNVHNNNHNRNALSASALMLNNHHHLHHHHHQYHHHSSATSHNHSHIIDHDDQSTLLANSISIHESQFGDSTQRIASSGQSSLSLVVFTVLDFLF